VFPSTRPLLTVGLPNFGHMLPDHRQILDIARAADDAGIDRLVVPDHVILGAHTEEYAWGRFPGKSDWPWLEPLTVLTAAAAVTSHVRLQTGILIAPLRPPALLAKTVATLDVLSGGRVDLGVGTGWQREEFLAQGMDFTRRGQLLDDTLAACRAMWTQMPASYDWAGEKVVDIYCSPRPVQPRLPVWVSGTLNERVLRRIIQHGDGWLPIMGATLDEIEAGIVRIRAAADAAGRSSDAFSVQVPLPLVRVVKGFDLDASMADVPALAMRGITDVELPLQLVCRTAEDAPLALADLRKRYDAATS
jgi:probable F420-dependent oxidoreductase